MDDYDFDNDQLGLFDEDTSDLYAADIGFEAQDEVSSALSIIFDDGFMTLGELIESGNRTELLEFFHDFYGQFVVCCDDEFNVDGDLHFELLLAEYDLPATMEIIEEV